MESLEVKMKMQIFPRGENRDTWGFTLIELAVVMFIISLVLWTALPKITTFGSGGVPDTLRGIASRLENTMEEAVFESAGGIIVINMARGSIKDMRGKGKDKMKVWSAILPDTLSIQGVTSNFGKEYRDTEVSITDSSM